MLSGFRVQTRTNGESWHTVRTWPGRAAAEGDARALFAESREIEGVLLHGRPLVFPRHPYVRVMHGDKVALVLDSLQRT